MKTHAHRPLAISLACIVVGIMFLVSIGLPVFYDSHGGSTPGFLCLLLGWVGYPCWLPNICLLVWCALLLKGKYRGALIVSVVSIALGLTSLLLEDNPMDMSGGSRIVAYGPGFYLWQSSHVASALISFFMFHYSQTRSTYAEKHKESAFKPPLSAKI